jgi:hypothetical protein
MSSSGNLVPPFTHLPFSSLLPDASLMCLTHRVHTEWQWPLSDVHSFMMEKLAQPGESWGLSVCQVIITRFSNKITHSTNN